MRGDREARLLYRDLLKFQMDTGCRRNGGFGLGSLDPLVPINIEKTREDLG